MKCKKKTKGGERRWKEKENEKNEVVRKDRRSENETKKRSVVSGMKRSKPSRGWRAVVGGKFSVPRGRNADFTRGCDRTATFVEDQHKIGMQCVKIVHVISDDTNQRI